MSQDTLSSAIAAFKSGNKNAAQQILSDLIKGEPNNESAWLWLSACLNDINQKMYCLNKVLSINPNNQNAQKAMAQLKPASEPSLEDIISSNSNTSPLSPTETAKEQKDLGRFRELLDVAMKAGNYKEAIEYCNGILGIEPKDVDTWIIKATAVCNSSTELVDHYDEGIEYLRKANQIAPNNEKIQIAFYELSNQHANWYLNMGAKYSFQAASYMRQGIDATRESIEAMEFSLKALKCQPDNFHALESVELMTKAGSLVGIRYGNDVQTQLQILNAWRAKKVAEQKLPSLHAELKRLSNSLAKLKTESGLFTGSKIKGTEANIQRVNSEIQSLEKAMNFEIPKATL